MSAFFCEACDEDMLAPKRPFVRFFGYARRIQLKPWLKESGDSRSLYERETGVRGIDALSTARLAVDPALSRRVEIDGDFEFWAHPVCCARPQCVIQLSAAIERGEWELDEKSYLEPTASSIMRPRETSS